MVVGVKLLMTLNGCPEGYYDGLHPQQQQHSTMPVSDGVNPDPS